MLHFYASSKEEKEEREDAHKFFNRGVLGHIVVKENRSDVVVVHLKSGVNGIFSSDITRLAVGKFS